ncbi:MAG: thioredoxin family protein [Bacteroidetes bacterium]|nr:thioredoxin family protein [Bacteroidota bacterium]MCL6103235.1 thioredoxin family protein [Bacteroidota bacterium]
MEIYIRKVGVALTMLFCLIGWDLSAQVISPVKWSFDQKKISDKEIEVSFHATIDSGWHLYGTDLPDGGPVSTTFKFTPDSTNYRFSGSLISVTKPVKQFDKIFNLELTYYAMEAHFTRRITLLNDRPFTIKGSIEYQSCNDETCTMDEADFSFPVNGSVASASAPKVETASPAAPAQVSKTEAILPEAPDNAHHSLIWFLFFSFIAGLAAILTPCVFPMIPMTVSFFMNSNKTKWEAKFQALVYGASIILIYTLIGTIVALTLGADFANWLSTHWLPNILFFVIFVVFAFSFFGAFEIILPSSWVNKSDDKVSKGGAGGAFFMALTLVLVSFSCTGPIVGAILVESAGGMILKPIVGMFGFSLAFALPFTLFALFPQWLSNLPKSGGWLNSVKVVLGFIELALGLKFLSIADQTYHWRILDREVYLAFWIVIFTLLGIYLLGKIKFVHDSEVKHVSVGRLMLAILTFTFVVYLVPGMFGAPLKAISGYLPPMTTHDFDLHKIIRDEVRLVGSAGNNAQALPGKSLCEKPKYSEFLELPHGLEGYFDFEQGLACAKAQNKPIFIDFTGHGCVNCREMEANVWSDPRVLERLNRDFVIIALYVDDKTTMPESDWVTSSYDHKVKKTIGKKFADFQIARFGVNAQPYYVILDLNQKVLVKPVARDLNPDHFIDFLDRGLAAFKDGEK